MRITTATLFPLFIGLFGLVENVIGLKVNKDHQHQRQLSGGPLDRGRGGYSSVNDDFGYISDAMLPDVHGDSTSLLGATMSKGATSAAGGPPFKSDVSTNLPAFSGTVTNAKPMHGGADDRYEEEEEPDEDDGYEDGGELLGNFDEDSRATEDRAPSENKHDSLDYTDNIEVASIDQIESFGAGNDGTPLPVFLVEPKSTYVMKNRPAKLYCKASHALQISFKCSGSTKPPTEKEHHTDPHSGVQLQEATATITRELVDEFFGKGSFKCECRAYSSRGHVKTQPVTIQVATIKKQISISPKIVRVATGGRAELNCIANATPAAKVVWLKNGAPVQANPPFVLLADNSLLIARVEIQDMANYTCVAENIVGKRVSEPVPITVYVDGGWSQWSSWTDCKCPGHAKQGQKRTRVCNSPVPINNGAPCKGASTESTPDCLPCSDGLQIVNPNGYHLSAGRWSSWSEWSECGPDCTQIRQRSCISSSSSSGSITVATAALVANSSSAQAFAIDSGSIVSCVGKSQQSIKCTGGMCNYTAQDSNWSMYLWVTLIAALCLGIFFAVFKLIRRKKTIPAYNLARSEMPTEYFANESKKLTHFQPDLTQNTGPINYEYPMTASHQPPSHPTGHLHHHHLSSLHHQHGSGLLGPVVAGHGQLHPQSQSQHAPTLPIGGLKSSLPLPRSNSEHHYDVPHLCNNYIYPLDKVSINESYSSSTYSKRVCSVESLETSTNTSADSAYDQAPMIPNNSSPAIRPTTLVEEAGTFRGTEVTHATLTPAGALLKLNTYSTALLIPEGAIPKHQRHSVVLSIVRDDKHHVPVPTGPRSTYLSPVVFCGPVDTKVNKPIVMKLPHCAENLSNWAFSLYSAPDNVTAWSKVVTIGEETINTPALVQIDKRYAYVLTETFGKYVLVGESATDIQERVACKKLRLFICGPSTIPEFSDVSLRIYIVEDNPGAEERCRHCEQEIGGVVLGRSTVLHFADVGQGLIIDMQCVGGWRTKSTSERQTIPFSHVWNSNCTALHCSFTLCRTEHDKCDFKIEVQATQDCGSLESLSAIGAPATMSISSFVPMPKDGHCQHSSSSFETMTICSVGSGSGDHTNVLATDRFRLSKDVKRKLCRCLDPPTQKRNDWRMLAAHLNVDRYLTYFATRPSPTDQILDLWECRNRELNALQQLIEICRTMERPDAVAILEQIHTAPWV
ncbi:netrin receptor unc-5-like isoform X1 [Anopheles maculipalpis]|uniref:netrin receptor unc-5-like isoform X1 n=1 Tax=Anopheles maculipalpis TaxID=1496333 RepID=UPI002158D786|nr:netrin receptor unc-5-like isoform X1 [Anopheles maculipalpis]